MPDTTAKGYVEKFLLARNYDDDVARLDLELVLSEDAEGNGAKTTLRCSHVRSMRYGDRDGINAGAHLALAIIDISGSQWDGLRFSVRDFDDVSLSFYCRDIALT